MKNLIIGKGEVGNSLFEVLSYAHDTYIRDVENLELEGVHVLNICFPYFDGFEAAVQKYRDQYAPALVIIHSTVPVGTSRKLDAVHSPIHGKHPNLADGIRTFVKYIGGPTPEQTEMTRLFLEAADIKVKVVSSPEASEASKLWCTTQYGWMIVLAKEIKEWCEKNGIPFDEVYGWNDYYNDGYALLGMPQFRRPVLDPVDGPIGGHCVIPNAKLLKTWISQKIVERNKTY